MMQGTTEVVPEMEEEEEERYVKLASRFFRVKPTTRGGGGATMPGLHYLESCFLCKKTIDCNRDIFMYKGDAAFCSEDCRLDQMDMDDALCTVARRQRLSSQAPGAAALGLDEASPVVMRRRPTIANLASRNPPVPAT